MSKKERITVTVIFLLLLSGIFFGCSEKKDTGKTIKVGVLHSLTGTMAISEKAVVDATLLAIEEINNKGGVLGRRIEPIVVDGRSDWPTFAAEAERLITEEGVRVIFGCWTSACRKTIKPTIEAHNHLLFYPVQYEGLEESTNIIYTGAVPNQQIIPALKWSRENLGKRVFLVASDYVFPRAANEIIKSYARSFDVEVVGEEYLLLGADDISKVIKQIKKTAPDFIINTINGDTNKAFFKGLKEAHISSEDVPVMSLSIGESELLSIGAEYVSGNYAAWSYFQSINTAANSAFIKRFKKRYGAERVIGDPMEAGYFGVYLWAKATEEAGSDNPELVISALDDKTYNAPEGLVLVDGQNLHLWRTARIGRLKEDGQVQILWSSVDLIEPRPYPIIKSREYWDGFLDELYKGWGGRWAEAGKP